MTAVTDVFPIELMRAMFIGMDPPKHDRLKLLFQAGFTPRRIAAHEPAIRDIVTAVLDRLEGRKRCDLRLFPAFAHFRRTATCDTELAGQPIQAGDKVVMWYVASGRDESRYEDPNGFDVTRNPEQQAFGAGGRHFCLGTALARLELRSCSRRRSPAIRRWPGTAR